MNTVKRPTVKEEFQRNPELKEEDLQHLRDWSSRQPHYPKNISDNDLIIFLKKNRYRLEQTKVNIENYYTCRTHVTEFFSNRDPLGSKELRTAMGTVSMIPLEETPDGYSALYAKFINTDVDQFVFYDGLRLFNMIVDLWIAEHGTMKSIILIVDITGVQMAHALRIPPIGVKKFLFYLQDANQFRVKAVHFINTTPVIDFLLGLMKPFIKKELMDKLHMHATLNSLDKFLPITLLPNESGGKAGPIMELHNRVIQNLEDHRQYFLAEETEMRIDESLRPSKTRHTNDLFGIEGSFKKLDID